MNREIKFRGQRIDTKEWVEGLVLTNKLGTYIVTEKNPHECTQYGYIEIDEYYRVNPETVGQYTGLNDKNGKEIYEGDIVQGKQKVLYNIKYHNNAYCITADIMSTRSKFENLWNLYSDDIEAIGNIHDNPELIKEVQNE